MRVTVGSKIRLKGGQEATITGIGMSDFIGDPYPIYYQYVDTETQKVVRDHLMSNELKERKQ